MVEKVIYIKTMPALRNKTFRSSEDIFEALKKKADELNISESDVVNKALRCFLGMNTENNCLTYTTELDAIKRRMENLIKVNNLKEV